MSEAIIGAPEKVASRLPPNSERRAECPPEFQHVKLPSTDSRRHQAGGSREVEFFCFSGRHDVCEGETPPAVTGQTMRISRSRSVESGRLRGLSRVEVVVVLAVTALLSMLTGPAIESAR